MAARAFRILVATDGSASARAAVRAASQFPWPDDAEVQVVAARETGADYRQSMLLAALDRGADRAAGSARRMLSRRWPDVETRVVGTTPVEGILDEARRAEADVIVLGWRGHGAIRRALMGSVSRGVIRHAPCAVLVVNRAQRVRRIVLGLDGSPMAERALEFVARLQAPSGGRVTLVTAVDVTAAPTGRLVPGARIAAAEVKRMNARRARLALQALKRAAARLKRAGWPTSTVLTTGEPLRDLLGAVASTRAQLLVVGACGTSGVRRLLLGSVAEGALNRCPVPVVIAR